jgi:hypothetical protein
MFAFELVQGANLSGPTPQDMIALGGDFAPLTRDSEPYRADCDAANSGRPGRT